MIKYLNKFLKKIKLPKNKIAIILGFYNELVEKVEETKINEVLNLYKDEKSNFLQVIKNFNNLTKSFFNNFESNLLCVCLLSKKLKELFASNKYKDSLFYETMEDISFKISECENVKGCTGIFVPEWYELFFKLKLFKFGRLQFELSTFKENYKEIKKDDVCLNIHIPRNGERLLPSLVDKSIKKASKFFLNKFRNKKILFKCESWILFTENKKFLSNESNIVKFSDRFEIVSTKYFSDYSELWRIFDCEYKGISSLKGDSSLRKGYIDLVRRKKKIGESLGFFYK